MPSQGGTPVWPIAARAWRGLAEGAPDRAGIGERERGGRQLAAHRRPRLAGEERQHLRPFEAAAARGEPERGGSCARAPQRRSTRSSA